jgi:tetratricopeptide (TPR) repeat protein
LASQADTAGWRGKLKDAGELTRRAMDSAQRNDAKETAANYQVAAALREVESGNREQARAEAKAAVELAPNRNVRAMAALVLARAGDTAGAEKLAAELGQPAEVNVILCPVYVRGEAYLKLHDSNAATEFQKFIIHRGLVGNFPWGALARLGLARAYALQGNTAKAKAGYQDFLTLWNDADPDVPILKEAKAEYAKLQ